jgi:trk system potassium uptake protein
MKVIIVGCGRVGSNLAFQLSQQGHQLTVIDMKSSSFDNLPTDFRGRTVEGDVLVHNVLHRAEIETADALVAVTSSDALNVLIAHLAKTEYGVARVLARNHNSRLLALQNAFNVPIMGAVVLGTQYIEELLSDEPLRILFRDSNTNFSIYQIKVLEEWHRRTLVEVLAEDWHKALTLIRADQRLPISESQTLETGDLIYLSASQEEIEILRKRLIADKQE